MRMNIWYTDNKITLIIIFSNEKSYCVYNIKMDRPLFYKYVWYDFKIGIIIFNNKVKWKEGAYINVTTVSLT